VPLHQRSVRLTTGLQGLVSGFDETVQFAELRRNLSVAGFEGGANDIGEVGEEDAHRMVAIHIGVQADSCPRHAIDQAAGRMVGVGKEGGIENGDFEQRNLQTAKDSFDGVRQLG